jgi:hypothetical protein
VLRFVCEREMKEEERDRDREREINQICCYWIIFREKFWKAIENLIRCIESIKYL